MFLYNNRDKATTFTLLMCLHIYLLNNLGEQFEYFFCFQVNTKTSGQTDDSRIQCLLQAGPMKLRPSFLLDTNSLQQFLGTGVSTLQVHLSQTKALITYLRINTQQITSQSFTYRQRTDEKIKYISLQYTVYYGLLWILSTSYHWIKRQKTNAWPTEVVQIIYPRAFRVFGVIPSLSKLIFVNHLSQIQFHASTVDVDFSSLTENLNFRHQWFGQEH